MFSYRSILSSAWTITKQHKKLWVFGFLAFMLSAGGEYQILTKILNEDYGISVYSQVGSKSVIADPSFWAALNNACLANPKTGLAIAMMLLLMFALSLGFLWLCIKSQIALVKWSKTYLVNKNKEKKASIWEELSTDDGNFWRVLGLNVSIKVIITALFSLLSLPLVFIYFNDSGFAILTYTLFFVVFLPLMLSFSLIIKYSIAEVVLEKQSFIKSIESGYKLFCKNWLISLEMAILLFLINFVIGLVSIFVLSTVILPIILTLIIFGLIIPLYLITAVSFFLLIIIASSLMTFQTSSWTLLFLELKNGSKSSPVKAKLERVFSKKKKTKK